MRISVARARWAHERQFLGELAVTCRNLGHIVGRADVLTDLHIQWGGRRLRDTPTLYAELGWLPRWHYQLSHTGINHSHHRQGEPLPMDHNHLQADRILAETRDMTGAPHGWGYLDTEATVKAVPSRFILAPLQMEYDTNMESIPPELRTNQGFVDTISEHVAEILGKVPILFKQHPDTKAGPQMLLKRRRKCDRIVAHSRAPIHAYLKHPNCLAVVTANSNTANDAILWGVPTMALGGGIWPDDMFLTTLRDIDLWALGDDYRDAYVCWLADVQWTLADARDPVKVAEAIEGAMQ